MNKIQKFIEENNLDFSGSRSELNGNCVILAGYALHIGFEEYGAVLDAFDPEDTLGSELNDEFERVFEYANKKMYGAWWESEKAKKMYKF